MPIYEFLCESCGKVNEKLQKVNDPPPARCDECGSRKLAKLVSRSAFQLKGGGWYSDLYASKKVDAAKPPAEGAKPTAEGAKPPVGAATPPTAAATPAKADGPGSGSGEKKAASAAPAPAKKAERKTGSTG
jgi:putative FmdB family regulatory protein